MTDLDDIREALAVPLCLAPLPRHACLCQHPAGHAGEHSGDQPPGVQMLRRAMVEVDRLTKAVGSFKTYAATIEREADKELDALRCVIGERDALRARLDATLTGQVAAWEETAAQHARNEDYYRGLLDEVAGSLGVDAFIADDGSVSESPLRAKVPELVRAMAATCTTLRAQLAAAEATIARLNRLAH